MSLPTSSLPFPVAGGKQPVYRFKELFMLIINLFYPVACITPPIAISIPSLFDLEASHTPRVLWYKKACGGIIVAKT